MSAALRTGPIQLPAFVTLASLMADYNPHQTRTAGRTSLHERVEAKLRARQQGTRTGMLNGPCHDPCGDGNGSCNSQLDGIFLPEVPYDTNAKQAFNRWLGISTRDQANGDIVNGNQVAPLGQAVITVSPQIPLVPKCLVVPSSIARFFRIRQMTIGVAPAVIGGSGVPAESFSEVSECNLAHVNRICSDSDLVMTVENIDPVLPITFDAVIKGISLR